MGRALLKIKYGSVEFTVNQLKEITDIVDNQNTTDREQEGTYTLQGEFGNYDYDVDQQYDITLTWFESLE